MTASDTWQWSGKAVQAELEDKVVLLGLENGKYYTLNRTASEIWKLLEQPKNLGEIGKSLAETFEMPEEGVEYPILKIIDYFASNDLITKI